MNTRKKIFLALMIMWMAGIFVFSSRSGDESAKDSYFAGTVVARILVPGFDEWKEDERLSFAEKIDHPVRKSAHAAEYAVLALLAAGVCLPLRREEKISGVRAETLLPWGIAVFYAVTDEFHQLFVPGRSGQVSDVLLDSAGALAGLLLLKAVRRLLRLRRKHVPESGEDAAGQGPFCSSRTIL